MSFSRYNNTRTGPCLDLRSVVAIEWRNVEGEDMDEPQRYSSGRNGGYTIVDKYYPVGSRRIYSIKPTDRHVTSHTLEPGETQPKESDDEISMVNDYIRNNPKGHMNFRLMNATEVSNSNRNDSKLMKVVVPINGAAHDALVLTRRKETSSNDTKTWQADVIDLDRDFEFTYHSTQNSIKAKYGDDWQGQSEVGMFNLQSIDKDFPSTATPMKVSCDNHLLIPEYDDTSDPGLFNLRLASELYQDQTLRYGNGKTRRLFDKSERGKESDLGLRTHSSIAILEWSRALN